VRGGGTSVNVRAEGDTVTVGDVNYRVFWHGQTRFTTPQLRFRLSSLGGMGAIEVRQITGAVMSP